MEKILVVGHRNPDTDSVCGSISLAYLKKQMGFNAEPRILSEINAETEFATVSQVTIPFLLDIWHTWQARFPLNRN